MDLDLTGYTQITPRFFYNRFLRLGGGAFGNVYKGYDSDLKRFIAVKQISRMNLFGFPQGELKEITIMKQLQHPNIMEYYGSSGDKNSPDGIFMFLELCEGGTLGNLIATKMTEMKAYELFKQLVQGMAYMNDKRLYHRDLKPDNLLLTASGELKIADFGIAREIQEGSATFKRCTPIYSAPEVYIQEIYQRNDEVYNEKCDVFSAGYILYQMLTSEQLNKGVKTALQLNRFLMNNKKKGGFQINHPALTHRWIELIRKMLAFDPNARLDFKAIRKLLTNFPPPGNNLPELRAISVEQKKESEKLLRKIKQLVQLISRRNNYLVGVLKVLHRFQQERSEVVPKVYKSILLFLSLCRFCYLSEDGLRQTSNKEAPILPDSELALTQIQENLILQDKVALTSLLKNVSTKINQGKEQIKLFLLGQIIPMLEEILSGTQSAERRVVDQYRLADALQKFRKNEYQLDMFYASSIKRCVNNLYRTAAQLQGMSDQDLKIYLVCLYVANIDSYVDIFKYEGCQLPPACDNILLMDRKELKTRIANEKNK